MSILDFFPGEYAPREVQKQALELIERNWSKADVFVVTLDVGTGKSFVAETIARWQRRSTIVVPSNALLDQYLRDFPDLCYLKGKDNYRTYREFQGAQARAKKSGRVLTNYHALAANFLHRSVLIADEAHRILPFLQDTHMFSLWKHRAGYPYKGDPDSGTLARFSGRESPAELLNWLDKKRELTKKERTLWSDLKAERQIYVHEHATDPWSGGGTQFSGRLRCYRGEETELPVLRCKPIDVSHLDPVLWPNGGKNQVRKIVLLSATIGPKDIEAMGLSRRRVIYLEADSPIAPENQPVIYDPIGAFTSGNVKNLMPQLIAHIYQKLRYRPEKGVLHVTYPLAREIEKQIKHSSYMFSVDPGRLMFHNERNAQQVLQSFLRSPVSEGKVLVAAGMHEGIDLAGDLARWQAIVKVPWPYLGDPAWRWLCDNDPEAYAWAAWKFVLQARGRVCRGPDDWGDTEVWDGTFERLLDQYPHMMSTSFRDGLRIGSPDVFERFNLEEAS